MKHLPPFIFSLTALAPGLLSAQTALFDINSDDLGNGLAGANLEGWTAIDIPNAATAGPFSATSGEINLSLSSSGDFRGRDRGTAATIQGADNNDNAVPVGAFADMYREFTFLLPADSLTGTLTGLVPNTNYFVTVISWDSGQGALNESDWGVTGDVTNRITYSGDLNNNLDISVDPNTEFLVDKSVTFVLVSDASGEGSFEGTSFAGAILAINGLVLDIDSDADGIPDSYEQQIIDADDADAITSIADVLPDGDFDNDMSTNLNEFTVGTDPIDSDSDDDDLLDGAENNSGDWVSVDMTGTNPLNADSDGDGLNDGLENHDLAYDGVNPLTQPGSDPNLFDTDEDGVGDGTEILVDVTDPTDPNSFFNPVGDVLVAFDFGPADVQVGWTAAPLGAGSNGAISVATEAVGGAELHERDRGPVNTDAGDTSNDAMWSDFIFGLNTTAGSTDVGLRVTITGLAPSTLYPVTIWAYDQTTVDVGGASMLWSDNSLTITGSDPSSLSDTATRVTFEAISDATGTIVLDGFTGTEAPVGPTNNVFLNGLVVGASLGSSAPVITSIVPDPDGNGVKLIWNSRPGVRYAVYASSDMLGAPETWADLDDGLLSGGDETSFIDSVDQSAIPRRFYVVLELAE